MNREESRPTLLYRALLAVAMIAIAAAVRIAPHPWNFTPVGAMALFSGVVVRDRRLAFLFPLLALFAGDLFVGFYNLKVMLMVYGSFLISVLIGRFLQGRRTILWIGGGTLLGAIQFFLISNFAVWRFLDSYPKTAAGLFACYLTGLPLFWNNLAGDALYVAVLFSGYALAERFVPALREPAAETR
jgi:hypothetical protein